LILLLAYDSYKPWAVVPYGSRYHGSDLFAVKEIQSTFFIDVGHRAFIMLAPTIGGYVTAAYGWHVVFNFNGYWNCGSVGRSFWVATYSTNRILPFR
jgi:hypothetical protein